MPAAAVAAAAIARPSVETSKLCWRHLAQPTLQEGKRALVVYPCPAHHIGTLCIVNCIAVRVHLVPSHLPHSCILAQQGKQTATMAVSHTAACAFAAKQLCKQHQPPPLGHTRTSQISIPSKVAVSKHMQVGLQPVQPPPQEIRANSLGLKM